MIFDKKIRIETRASFGNENSYDYYNNSAREDIAQIRSLIKKWYGMYPDHEKFEIEQRLKSAFYPAFYELAMFAYFKNSGLNLAVHPKLPNSKKRPDFLATIREEEFYIEIKEMRLSSDSELLRTKKLNTLLDSLNLIDCTNFLLSIQKIEFKDGRQPSGKKIVAHFDKIISGIEPDRYRILLESNGFSYMPYLNYTDDSVYIEVRLIPKAPDRRRNNGRAIGMYGMYSKIGGDEAVIKQALVQKATRYGNLDKPFLICLNYPSSFLDSDDVNTALFGSDYMAGENGFEGFFGSPQLPKNKRVSAIIVTDFTVSGLVNGRVLFFRNPFAAKPISFEPPSDLIKSLGLDIEYVKIFST